MNSRKHIQEELRSLNSSLPYDMKEPVFSVPNNYFENFAASVLQKIKKEAAPSAADELASLSPTLAGLSKKMPFEVPENYFNTLVQDVPAIFSDEVLPAVLANHERNLPYEVPAGYFDTLPEQLLAKVAPKQAKVISFNRTRWMKVAAAAMIAGVISISGFLYFGKNESIDPAAQSEIWVAKKLQNVSNQDLEQFIETADIAAGRETARTNRAEVRNMLDDVSVKELDAFLSQIPTDDELSIIN